jgi:hypothetical protein
MCTNGRSVITAELKIGATMPATHRKCHSFLPAAKLLAVWGAN